MDEVLANKIVAGEVVEKTMNVVEELVENSIDAKSSEIIIKLIDSGVKEIEVSDDGIGMDEEDAKMADGRYSTTLDGAHVCDFKADTSNCYVLVGGQGNRNYEIGSVEFSDLKVQGNIITGSVKKYYDSNNKDFYVDGAFAFEFEKTDNHYIIKSLKITG